MVKKLILINTGSRVCIYVIHMEKTRDRKCQLGTRNYSTMSCKAIQLVFRTGKKFITLGDLWMRFVKPGMKKSFHRKNFKIIFVARWDHKLQKSCLKKMATSGILGLTRIKQLV